MLDLKLLYHNFINTIGKFSFNADQSKLSENAEEIIINRVSKEVRNYREGLFRI